MWRGPLCLMRTVSDGVKLDHSLVVGADGLARHRVRTTRYLNAKRMNWLRGSFAKAEKRG
eukprot:SAG11_NODE_3621_length_2332_cov_2.130766_2_plen_60_part_00